ncbi:MAG: hypothetical protein ABR540_20965 [Acidimicrobiales bacterium]
MTADIDRDGCAETVRFQDGVVETGGMRWTVGQPGDLAAVGDWELRRVPVAGAAPSGDR